MTRNQETLLDLSLAWLLCVAGPPLRGQPQAAQPVTLSHHVVGSLSDSRRLPHTQAMEQDPLRLTVVLNLSDESGRDAFLDGLKNPGSPNYRNTISLAEFTARGFRLPASSLPACAGRRSHPRL